MGKVVQIIKTYRREVLIVAGALVFVAVVLGALAMVRARGRNVMSRAIGEVGDLAAAAVDDPAKLADLEKLAVKGPAARLAKLELARYWAGKGDWTKAAEFAGRIGGGRKDLVHYQAEDLKAQIALGRKDFDAAIAIYRKAVDEKPEVYPVDALLFRLAESHELKGETAAALDIYKKLQEEHAQSYYGYEASLKAGRLGLSK
jgi:ATP/maltotriose-dependent transcriptional regulator MalT